MSHATICGRLEFFVHTHNLVAGLLMVMQMRSSGFKAEMRPFGQDLAKVLAHNEPRRKDAPSLKPGAAERRRWPLDEILRWPARRQPAHPHVPRRAGSSTGASRSRDCQGSPRELSIAGTEVSGRKACSGSE